MGDGNDIPFAFDADARATRAAEEGRGGLGTCFCSMPGEIGWPDREVPLSGLFDWSFAACARWITDARSVPAGSRVSDQTGTADCLINNVPSLGSFQANEYNIPVNDHSILSFVCSRHQGVWRLNECILKTYLMNIRMGLNPRLRKISASFFDQFCRLVLKFGSPFTQSAGIK